MWLITFFSDFKFGMLPLMIWDNIHCFLNVKRYFIKFMPPQF